MKLRSFLVMVQLLCGISLGLSPSYGEGGDLVSAWGSHALLTDSPCDIPDYRLQLSGDFSQENALILLISSWIGHARDPQLIYRQFRQWGFLKITTLGRDDKGVLGVLAEHEKALFLTFRGSESAYDYLDNAFIIPNSAEKLGLEGRIHAGWLQRFERIRSELDQALAASDREHKPLIVAGHSMGAAISVIASLYRLKKGDDLLMLYAFAQPRIGDDRFRAFAAKNLAGRYYRLINEEDLTPQIPPSRLGAQAFASIISERLPDLRHLLYDFVDRLGYADHAGELYSFGERSALRRELRSEIDVENAFWSSIQREFGELGSWDDLRAIYRQRCVNHHPHFYICHLASFR